MNRRSLTPTELAMAQLIVTALDLEIAPDDIDPDSPLFGDGLGLDSIDALVISLEISKRYGIQIKADDERTQRIFGSLSALCGYVQNNGQE